jgi:SAM-dependent methyltransferase
MKNKSTINRIPDDFKLSNGYFIPTDFVMMKKSFKKEIKKNFLLQMKDDSSILDLNAGLNGMYTELNLPKTKYCVLEQNRFVRDELRTKNIDSLDWNALDIPYDNNSFDYVFSLPFVEHMPTYLDAVHLLREVRRVLKPGGRLIVVVPNYLNLQSVFFEDYKHGWVTTKKRMFDMLSDVGYTVKSCRYTIGWITMAMNPAAALLRFLIWCFMAVVRLYVVQMILDFTRLNKFVDKIKKTVFELIVIEAVKQ